MHSTSPVVVPGPLAPFAAGFDAELARLGYTPDSAYGQLRLAAELSAWLASAGMGLAEVTAETLEVFLAGRRAGGYSRGRTGRAFAPLVAYLRGLAVVPPGVGAVAAAPADQLLARYRSYLISERGLQVRTCGGYVHLVRPFLAARVVAGTLDLQSVTSADVTGFLVQVSRVSSARKRRCGRRREPREAARCHSVRSQQARAPSAMPSASNWPRCWAPPRFLETARGRRCCR